MAASVQKQAVRSFMTSVAVTDRPRSKALGAVRTGGSSKDSMDISNLEDFQFDDSTTVRKQHTHCIPCFRSIGCKQEQKNKKGKQTERAEENLRDKKRDFPLQFLYPGARAWTDKTWDSMGDRTDLSDTKHITFLLDND